MLHLKVVKSTTKEKAVAAATATSANNNDDAPDEGKKETKFLLELTEPWLHNNPLITANAYFTSVKVALKLKKKHLIFIGNVKQCSRRFLMEVLGNTTLLKQELQSVLALINDNTGKTELVAMSWLDRNCCFFVTTTCGIGEGCKTSTGRAMWVFFCMVRPMDR